MLTGEASPPESEPAGDCCEACAAANAAAHADVPDATPRRPMLPIIGGADPRVRIARSTDRLITLAGLIVAAIYLGLAAASITLPPALRLGTWLPAHLALAGAAATAIAAVLPFFTAALAVAAPVRPALRIAGIALVAGGALAAMSVYGLARGSALAAAVAGGAFIAGIGLVGLAALAPLRRALGPRRRLVERAYAVALADVAVGATIATLLIGGNAAVGEAWGSFKPAHAWLNLVGFVGLTIVASLLHLAPTVAGSRMRPRASGRLAVVGLAIGAPLVATGYALRLDLVAGVGALIVLAGAAGVAVHAVLVQRDGAPGRWTTDADWHLMTAAALVAGQLWLASGLGLAAIRVLAWGADPAGWALAPLVGPLLIGGVVQVLIGAMTHLVPAIGPGDSLRHAAQRRLLGSGAALRLGALNAGAVLVTLGIEIVGFGLAAAGIGASLGLIGVAARPRIGGRRASPAGVESPAGGGRQLRG